MTAAQTGSPTPGEGNLRPVKHPIMGLAEPPLRPGSASLPLAIGTARLVVGGSLMNSRKSAASLYQLMRLLPRLCDRKRHESYKAQGFATRSR